MIRYRCDVCNLEVTLQTPLPAAPRCIGETCGHAFLTPVGEVS